MSYIHLEIELFVVLILFVDLVIFPGTLQLLLARFGAISHFHPLKRQDVYNKNLDGRSAKYRNLDGRFAQCADMYIPEDRAVGGADLVRRLGSFHGRVLAPPCASWSYFAPLTFKITRYIQETT